MTYEEAISELYDIFNNVLEFKDYRTTKSFEMAIEALEKQIPMKPNEVDYDSMTFDCPSCGEKIIAMEDGFTSHKHCLNCGQRIDWNDVTE